MNREQCRQTVSQFLIRRETTLICGEFTTTIAEPFSCFKELYCIEIDSDFILLFPHQLSIYNPTTIITILDAV
jgi:hypothetical protein